MHPLSMSATFFFFLAVLLSDRVMLTGHRLMWERSETYRRPSSVSIYRRHVLDGEIAPRLKTDIELMKGRAIRFLVFIGFANLTLAILSGGFSSPEQLATTMVIMILILTLPLYLYLRVTEKSKTTGRRILKPSPPGFPNDPLKIGEDVSGKALLKSWIKTWIHFFLYVLAYAVGRLLVVNLLNTVWR